jgi:C4-type Zn-finger protein
MASTINNKLENIENFLERIESKLDNFLGFEELTSKEKEEFIKIKKEMDEGQAFSYDDVFN